MEYATEIGGFVMAAHRRGLKAWFLLTALAVLVGGAVVGTTNGPAAQAATGASGTLLRQNVGLYPRLVRLQHSGSANGTILGSVVTFDGNTGLGAIYASRDEGKSFEQIGTVADPASANGKGLCCATLYELPRRVGDLPAGTLLWASSAGQSTNPRQMSIPIWASHDHGRTWSHLATPVVAQNTGGLWEPEFTVTRDGRLVVFYSDETDQPAHSQMLVAQSSADGVHWTDRERVVASDDPAARPGMSIVRRIAGGRYLMTYEVCGPSYDCKVHYRESSDGAQWGDPSDLGPTVRAADGTYFEHTPTITWEPGRGREGRLFLTGQMLYAADGTVAEGNGRTVFVSDNGPAGPWRAIPAPVSVPDPYNNYCPNYSSPLLTVRNGTRLLEIATAYDSDGVCKAYYATGSEPVAR
ncbi:sialidase family protein [Actinopolymorpha rutila]|uniref:BNR repeat-like domain-containing protein n=1 Tax=Actinopolymorpha rutila TaxID=446787 RepID=A0A852ZGP5_9ACTN|nr:sialidase family protein [Actinopolymorpha rutila]NYH92094.1 hypothetical protein [Actinopolymorpha rutila]